jgi:hypothetical protein
MRCFFLPVFQAGLSQYLYLAFVLLSGGAAMYDPTPAYEPKSTLICFAISSATR